MKDWSQAVENFLKRWEDRKEFEGVILCGSYAIGCQKEGSYIDRWTLRTNVRV